MFGNIIRLTFSAAIDVCTLGLTAAGGDGLLTSRTLGQIHREKVSKEQVKIIKDLLKEAKGSNDA